MLFFQGLDTTVYTYEGPALSSAAIIGIVIAGVILMLIVVDVLLCCCRRQGVIATICYKKSKQHDEDEAKLGRSVFHLIFFPTQFHSENFIILFVNDLAFQFQ